MSQTLDNCLNCRKKAFLMKILIVLTLQILALHGQESQHVEPQLVIESNHFYSNTTVNVLYNIRNIEKNRPLILFLKNKTSSETSLPVDQNNVDIALLSKAWHVSCLFDSYDDLCVMK